MEDEKYYKGKYDELTSYRDDLIKELHKWKVAFGWTLAGMIIALLLAILIR